jgi:hypothetical protein
VFKEQNTRMVHVVVFEQTNVAIIDHVAKISVELAKKKVVDEKLMAFKWWVLRELEEKVATDAGYAGWQAYWRQRREKPKVTTAARKAVKAVARMKAMNHQPNRTTNFCQPR